MVDIQTVSKGSMLGLAMVCVSSGVTQIVRNDLAGGIILLLFGFGFVMWREYLKVKYYKRANRKKKRS